MFYFSIMRCKYSSADILLDFSDVNKAIDFRNLITYLEVQGPPYYKNTENPDKKEFHYFCCDSPILITEFPQKAEIKIISPRHSSSERMKSKIENILNRV
jgi:hypothetical protein